MSLFPKEPSYWPSIYILGTLNIDGSSRPPSPKMLDRFGLIEFEPQNPLEHKHLAWKDVQKLTSSLGLIHVDTETVGSIDKRLTEVVNGVFGAVCQRGLQSDFLPSRRVADYLKSLVHGRRDQYARNFIQGPSGGLVDFHTDLTQLQVLKSM